jgi:hypothetical protein
MHCASFASDCEDTSGETLPGTHTFDSQHPYASISFANALVCVPRSFEAPARKLLLGQALLPVTGLLAIVLR